MRKICIITGTRAEYGLLRWVMQGIKDDPELKLQIVATGMHLSPEFGLTYRDIEEDGFLIDSKVEMLMSSDTSVGVAKSVGIGLIGFADTLSDLRPDLVIVLGDRFEIFSAVFAALAARIPVAHLHGGEVTEGSIDEAIRHSITKMSHFHFVANEKYRQRVIQLGEHPERVYMVGGLGIDNIKRLKLLTRLELEDALKFKLGKKFLVITFHPTSLEIENSACQMAELLAALDKLSETKLIFTFPNADTDGRILINMIEEFVKNHDNSRVYKNLGQLRYLSCIAHADGVVGNSSSGIIEAPSLKTGTINIGDRQRGRLKAKSIIDAEPNEASISSALKRLYSNEFQKKLPWTINPYGDGNSSEKVIKVIKFCSLSDVIKKNFYDLE